MIVQKVNTSSFYNRLSIKRLNTLWHNEEKSNGVCTMVGEIYKNMRYLHRIRGAKEHHDFYVVTTQTKHLNMLNPKKILAISEIENFSNTTCKLNNIEVNPKYSIQNPNREIKHIGQSMIEFLKEKFDKIILFPFGDVTKFYEKLGFKLFEEPDCYMVFIKAQ